MRRLAFLALLAYFVCNLPAAQAAEPERPQLELKGLTIGTPLESMPKSFDEMDCEESPPGIVFCRDLRESFAGQPTQHTYCFLDGKLIRIDIYGLEVDTYETVAQLMLQKFGAADEVFSSRGPIGSGSRQRTTYAWDTGSETLRLLPFQDRRDDGRYYPLVQLIDRDLFDNHWLPRSRSEAPRSRSAMAEDI